MLRSSPFDSRASPRARFRDNSINARPIGSALFNPSLVSSSPPAAFVRTDNSGRPIAAMRRADSLSPARVANLRSRHLAGTGLLRTCPPPPADAGIGRTSCLHALSSFQRTDRLCARGAQPPGKRRTGCIAGRVQGNLLRLLEGSNPVNPNRTTSLVPDGWGPD